MKPIEIDSESYRRAKVQIGQSTQDTEAALQRFVGELESKGEPWGNDDLGSLIAMSYQGIYAAAMDCFTGNLRIIEEYAERLGRAADDYDRADSDNATQVEATTANLPNLPL